MEKKEETFCNVTVQKFIQDMQQEQDEMAEMTKTVCIFMVQKFIQDMQRTPNSIQSTPKESFIEFKPVRDPRPPHPLNNDWDRCNSYVNFKWSVEKSVEWAYGLTIVFGNYMPRKDEQGKDECESIAPNTQKLVQSYREAYNVPVAYAFPPNCLSNAEILNIFDTLINKDYLIYITRTW